MTEPVPTGLYQACQVRFVEEELLRLFSAGKLHGTTHTCIGQEMSAVVLAECLDRKRDIIHSNHRCHGHYLAWTDDVEGLIAEVMGKRTGVCGGLGGSQHLHAERFFSNGIQGGIVPVSAGLAFAAKLAGQGGIVAACIGDGTLGEGVVYETFNIAAKWRLPLLFVLENNQYAQSTSQRETLAGDICDRPSAFGIPTFRSDTWNYSNLQHTVRRAVDLVRGECAPAFVCIDTYRLAAHSKGDDNRDSREIEEYSVRDPVNLFLSRPESTRDEILTRIRSRITRAVEQAQSDASSMLHTDRRSTDSREIRLAETPGLTQLEAINQALLKWMTEDPRVILLGEDIRSPYGGAFKVTRGLSDTFPDRVLNTPISEAAIVGIGNGLGLGGRRPVVEIMFGDFLALCFDQLLNHAAKFRRMYHERIVNPLIVRTPMGGGRGYGPTHSQNLEKHFVGVPGLKVVVLHGRAEISRLYGSLREALDPTLIIENKLLYRERPDSALPAGYSRHDNESERPTTVLRPPRDADVTIVAFGRMSVLAEKAATALIEEEIWAELIFPLEVSPLDATPVLQSVQRTRRLVVVEEGAIGFDLGAEVITRVCTQWRERTPLHCRRIAAEAIPIPSSAELEQQVLPAVESIVATCLDVFDE
jgi:2-oxoisovalerate dehydrogenase E1 component